MPCICNGSRKENVQARADSYGSRLSKKAVKAGIAFAKELGAEVTAYHAVEVIPLYTEGSSVGPSVFEQFETGARKQAVQRLFQRR